MPKFWKVSHGPDFFTFGEIIESINSKLVYVHKETKRKATSKKTQAEDFVNADIGDYFYLTHGNTGIYLLGQFVGPASKSLKYSDGWLEREYKLVFGAKELKRYSGEHKRWSPKDYSTFTPVPKNKKEMKLFEDLILQPHFGVKMDDFLL